MPPISAYRKPPLSVTPVMVSGTSTKPVPPRKPDPQVKKPVEQIKSTPAGRSGAITTYTRPTVGQPLDQSGVAERKAAFTTSNLTDSSGAAALTAAEKQKNLDAVAARKDGILGCIGKSKTTAATPGCNPCDTVDCLTKMLTGNVLDLDAKKLMCDTVSSTERALKRQIDSTGDQLLNAAQTLTSLNPVIAPLNTLQGFVNKIDPGQVANCFGAQALKDKVNGQFNKAKNTIKKFQKGYQDKIAEKFNKVTEAAQQFSITPNLCADKNATPWSLREGIGGLIG